MRVAPNACLVSLLLGLVSCGGGEPVALNERLFTVSSMESMGAGCTLFELGGEGDSSTGTSALGFEVSQSSADDHVLVQVKAGDHLVVERRYDESFFRSEKVDEFVAQGPGTSGDLLLRYWGKFHPNGTDGCTSLDDDGAP